jgi:hypothetical protein
LPGTAIQSFHRSLGEASWTRLFSRLVFEDTWYFDLIRRYVYPTLIKTPLQKRIKQTVSGLDHPLPADVATAASCCEERRSPVVDDLAILSTSCR